MDNSAMPGPSAPSNGAAREAKPLPPEGAREEAMHRAEELADQLGERVGAYASWLGQQVLKLGARVKEEAADIWAEAQHLARGGPSDPPAR
jgi:hypothetical protein